MVELTTPSHPPRVTSHGYLRVYGTTEYEHRVVLLAGRVIAIHRDGCTRPTS